MSDGKHKVLIVDDEPTIRNLLALIVGGHATYSVSGAEDGASALQSMEREAPDILLTDLYMPGMAGIDLIAAVRAVYPAVRVIAMSGTPVSAGVPEGLSADAYYLKDGRNWTDLIKTLEDLCATIPSNPSPAPSGAA